MVRTQIYLTEPERQALRALTHRTGRTQSELIREAVDRFIAHSEPLGRAYGRIGKICLISLLCAASSTVSRQTLSRGDPLTD